MAVIVPTKEDVMLTSFQHTYSLSNATIINMSVSLPMVVEFPKDNDTSAQLSSMATRINRAYYSSAKLVFILFKKLMTPLISLK